MSQSRVNLATAKRELAERKDEANLCMVELKHAQEVMAAGGTGPKVLSVSKREREGVKQRRGERERERGKERSLRPHRCVASARALARRHSQQSFFTIGFFAYLWGSQPSGPWLLCGGVFACPPTCLVSGHGVRVSGACWLVLLAHTGAGKAAASKIPHKVKIMK